MTRADEIRARAAKATEGPWHWNTTNHIVYDDQPERVTFVCADVDAEFIAHAREDIPWLLAERDRLTKNLDTLFEGGNR